MIFGGMGGMIPKAQATKAKINKWDYISLKNLLQSKGNHQQNVKATHRMGKTFASLISD